MTKFCKMSTQVNVYEVAAQHSHDKTLLLLLYYRTEKNMRNDETTSKSAGSSQRSSQCVIQGHKANFFNALLTGFRDDIPLSLCPFIKGLTRTGFTLKDFP